MLRLLWQLLPYGTWTHTIDAPQITALGNYSGHMHSILQTGLTPEIYDIYVDIFEQLGRRLNQSPSGLYHRGLTIAGSRLLWRRQGLTT